MSAVDSSPTPTPATQLPAEPAWIGSADAAAPAQCGEGCAVPPETVPPAPPESNQREPSHEERVKNVVNAMTALQDAELELPAKLADIDRDLKGRLKAIYESDLPETRKAEAWDKAWHSADVRKNYELEAVGEPGTPLGRSADAVRMVDNARDALNDAKLASSENPDSLELKERVDIRRIELGDALKTAARVCGAALEQAREGKAEPGEISELERRLWIAAIDRDKHPENPVMPETALGRAEAADRAWDKARGEFFAARSAAKSEFGDHYHYVSTFKELRGDMVASRAALRTFAIAEVSECEKAVAAAKTDAARRAGVSVDDPRVNDDPHVMSSLRRLEEAKRRMNESDELLNQPDPAFDRINGILEHASGDVIDDRD